MPMSSRSRTYPDASITTSCIPAQGPDKGKADDASRSGSASEDRFKRLPAELLRKIADEVDRLETDPKRWASYALVSRSFCDAFRDQDVGSNRHHFAKALCAVSRQGPEDIRCFARGAWVRAFASAAYELELDGVTAEALDGFPNFVHLKRLRWTGLSSSPKSLGALRHFPQLTELSLRWVSFPGDEARHVSSLRYLRKLDMARTNLDSSGAAMLAHLPALADLDVYCCKALNGAGLCHFSQTSTLTHLRWSKDGATEADIEGMSKIASLRSLTLEDFYTKHWPRLCCLQSLRSLSLESFGLTAEKLSFLGSLPHLTSLRLNNIPPDRPCLHWVRGVTNLQSLSMRPGELTEDGLRVLRDMPHLQHLSLPDARVGVGTVAELARLPKLESLALIGASISEKALPELASLRTLTCLSLCTVRLGDAGLEHISELTRLRWLDVTLCGCTAAGRQKLLEWARPKKLSPFMDV